MIIDAHTHIFPDKIAEKSIYTLEILGKQKAVIGGRAVDLLSSMEKSGVDKSVVLPVLTKPEQFDIVNRFAAELNKKQKIISLGAIHPLCENINNLLDILVGMGFKGIKLHPDYQKTDISDNRYLEIIAGCRKRGLKVIIHAGQDPASPEHIHCPPELSSQVVKELTPSGCEPYIVLAHLGGAESLDKVERLLVGLPVYFDTSFVLEKTERTRIKELIRAHGQNKILFGTDSQKKKKKHYIKLMKDLKLKDDEYKSIMGENASKLLDL